MPRVRLHRVQATMRRKSIARSSTRTRSRLPHVTVRRWPNVARAFDIDTSSERHPEAKHPTRRAPLTTRKAITGVIVTVRAAASAAR